MVHLRLVCGRAVYSLTMPKPNYMRNKAWAGKSSDYNHGQPRRVSFKPNRGDRYHSGNGPMHFDLRARFENPDLFQENFYRRSNYIVRRKRGSPPPPGKSSLLTENPLGWYRVQIPYGTKYDKKWVLQKLLEHVAPLPLIPCAWQESKNTVLFFIEEFATAQKLNGLQGQIETPDGFKLIVKVGSGAPFASLSNELREKMKQVMAKRYDPINKALDLTRFHAAPELQSNFCPLFRPSFLLAAIDIISDNITDLEKLCLQNNKIYTVSHLKDMAQKLPHLKMLDISKNKIDNISQFDGFLGTPLVELILDENGLCDHYKDQSAYISDVRKRFPRLLRLDGFDLPTPISFDIEEVPIPVAKQTFLCHAEGHSIVRQFLEQYYQIMDSPNRQPLLQAYHVDALFSLTMGYPFGAMNQKCATQLNWYSTENRNLERVTNIDRRRKLLKQGNIAVVAFLQDMPETQHDLNNFTVDLMVCTPHMMVVTVSGQFKEIKSKSKLVKVPIRHFLRTFTIVPAGAGYCINNDMFHITNATQEQLKTAFQPSPSIGAAEASTAGAHGRVPLQEPAPTTVTNVPEAGTQQQMIQSLAQETGMNLAWSQKCLQESNWEYPRAQAAFNAAKSSGVIPGEAFLT